MVPAVCLFKQYKYGDKTHRSKPSRTKYVECLSLLEEYCVLLRDTFIAYIHHINLSLEQLNIVKFMPYAVVLLVANSDSNYNRIYKKKVKTD